MVVLAILLPPVAVLLATKNPLKAVIAFGLWCIGLVPGMVYAVVVVNQARGDKRLRQMERRIVASQAGERGR